MKETLFLIILFVIAYFVMKFVRKTGAKGENAVRRKLERSRRQREAENQVPYAWNCPLCGKPQTTAAEYCRNCGTRRNETGVQQ